MFRRFWLGQTVSLVGDQVSLIALPLVAVLVLDANAAQMGYLVAAELLPNLLFSLHAGAWADRRARKRQHDDRDRPRPRAPDRLDPGRLRVRRADVPAHARRRVPDGDADRPLPRLLQLVLPRARAARPPRRGRLDHARQPGPLLRRRPERRRRARAGDLGSRDARRRRVLVRRLGPLPPIRRRRRAGDRDAREGPRRLGRALGLRQPDHPGCARRDRHDQLLQLRLLRALHPLRDDRARRLAGDARARAGRRRGRRHPRRRRHGPGHPPDRRRACVRARLRPLPRAASARPARRRDRTR